MNSETQSLGFESKLKLPPRLPIRYHLGGETGWANHYGGVEVLSDYCGLISRLPISFNATWQHGIVPPWVYRLSPSALTCYIKHGSKRLIFVENHDQEASLRSIGYENVHPIGAPYLYAEPRTKPKRISGSVLLMPPHTLDNAPFEVAEQLLEYRDYVVAKYYKRPALLCACVHMSCVRNGQWVKMLRDSGAEVITGADHNDRNSLLRMWQIFSQFETISTSCHGSHVYYALAAGCSVVIEGPKINYTRDQALKDDSYKRALDRSFDYLSDQAVLDGQRSFERAFESPRRDQDMALEAMGALFKKSPLQINRLLSWSRWSQIKTFFSHKNQLLKRKIKTATCYK